MAQIPAHSQSAGTDGAEANHAALQREGHEITVSERHLRMSEHAAAADQADEGGLGQGIGGTGPLTPNRTNSHFKGNSAGSTGRLYLGPTAWA